MRRKRSKKKSMARRIFRLLLVGLFLFGIWHVGSLAWEIRGIFRDGDKDYEFVDDLDDEIPEPPSEELETLADPNYVMDPQRLNILLIGVDNPGEGSRRSPLSDSIMLFSLHKNSGDAVLISIPRDTYVHIPGHGNDKINHSHAFGGAALLRQSIEGFMGLEIDYYLRVDFTGFREIVDMLGGVEINIEKDMPKYNFQAGRQTLSGAQALLFCRDREDSDYSRMGRQQQFLVAMMQQVKSGSFSQFSQFIQAGAKHVDTDMPLFTLLDFSRQCWELGPDQILRYRLPGTVFKHEGIYYMQANVDAAASFLNQNLKLPR